jgi:hypothetical protein
MGLFIGGLAGTAPGLLTNDVPLYVTNGLTLSGGLLGAIMGVRIARHAPLDQSP